MKEYKPENFYAGAYEFPRQVKIERPNLIQALFMLVFGVVGIAWSIAEIFF